MGQRTRTRSGRTPGCRTQPAVGQAYVTFVTLVFLAGWWLPDRKLDAECFSGASGCLEPAFGLVRAKPETVVYPVAMPIDTKQTDSGVAVVTVSGRLVLGRDVERLETVVGELLKQDQKKFVFDISALDYADSSGIGTLVACLTHIRKAGGDLRMAGANARMLRLFQMTGVTHLMSLYATVAEASAA